jgi:hypothetical protein
MKHLPLLLAILFFAVPSKGQNLVNNGDFENYSTCPTTLSQTTNCTGWRSFTNGTSDYFNCTLAPTQTFFGYQQAASGTAYMGGYAFTGNNQTTNTYKEYVAGTMIPMQVGIIYEVSMSVNLANVSGYGTDDLGIFLYDNGPASFVTNSVAPVTPQILFNSYGPIGDTVNWVRLVANFYADSAYDNIVIGSWQQSAVSNQITVPPGNVSYYYFDSVVVRVATKVGINYSDSLLCAGQTIAVPYTVNSPGYFLSGNIFTLQLSDATGSFLSPVTLATQAGTVSGSFTNVTVPTVPPGTGYRIRVVSSNPTDTSNVSLKPISIGSIIPAKPVITATNPCAGQTLSLNATTNTAGVNYKWTGPNSFTATTQSPSITNATTAANGDYFVTVWLYGCPSKDTETVVINPQPTAITAGGNTPICQGETLNLTSTNSTTGATYSWTGPNSFTSNTQNPTITNIPAAGNGNYIVTANLNGCTTQSTVAIVVKPLPANFSASSNSPVCSTKPLNLLGNTTSTGVTFSWAGPGAFNSTSPNPTIATSILANAGDYILTATLNGCSIKDTETVVVNQSPAGAVVASANTPVCQNTTLSLAATSAVSGSVYSWTGPSFTSSAQTPIINTVPLTAAGDYIVSVSLNGCTEKDTVTVTVLAAPTNVNATTNAPICAGQTLNLGVTNNTSGVTYSWSGPSFSSSLQNPTIATATTSATGDYIATLSINGCVIKDTVTAVVHPIPTTPVASSNTPVCNGNMLNLYATNSLPGATYNWSGPSYTSTQQNPVINNANLGMAGTYTVSASLNGCTSASTNTKVTILYFPTSVSVYTLPNDTICVGGSIQFIGVASNGGTNPQFQWLKNGFVIPGATSISYTTGNMVTGDKFSVKLTPDNTCPDPDTSAAIEVTVLPWLAPEVSITASPNVVISPWQTVTFKATPVNGGKNPTYQWKRNGQDVVGAVNDTWGAYTLNDNDAISVVMYSSYNCPLPATATSNSIVINVKLGVADVDNANDFVLYPNPNNGNFTLKGNVGTSHPVAVEVWNSIGQLVYRNTLQPQNNILNTEITLDKTLAQGLYILKLNTGGEATKLLRFTINK